MKKQRWILFRKYFKGLYYKQYNSYGLSRESVNIQQNKMPVLRKKSPLSFLGRNSFVHIFCQDQGMVYNRHSNTSE